MTQVPLDWKYPTINDSPHVKYKHLIRKWFPNVASGYCGLIVVFSCLVSNGVIPVSTGVELVLHNHLKYLHYSTPS